MFIFIYIVMVVYEASAKFKFALTKWSIMVLFCSAPMMGWCAAAVPADTAARKVLVILCGLLHCALFVIGYIQSFKEMKSPSEVTDKFITGPHGQKFTAYSTNDVERGESAHYRAELDLAAPSKREEA